LNELVEITLRSLFVSGSATLLAALFGLPLGLWLGARGQPQRLAASLLYAGMGLPPVVVGLFFYFLLSRSGPLGSLGLLYTVPGMILAESVLAFPLIAGFAMAGVAAKADAVRRLVKSLGGSELQVHLTLLAESRRVVVAALAAGFGAVISEVGGGDIRHATRVLTTAVVIETRKGELERAAALGAVLLGVTLLITAILVVFGEREAR